jgi:hypothetical protein
VPSWAHRVSGESRSWKTKQRAPTTGPWRWRQVLIERHLRYFGNPIAEVAHLFDRRAASRRLMRNVLPRHALHVGTLETAWQRLRSAFPCRERRGSSQPSQQFTQVASVHSSSISAARISRDGAPIHQSMQLPSLRSRALFRLIPKQDRIGPSSVAKGQRGHFRLARADGHGPTQIADALGILQHERVAGFELRYGVRGWPFLPPRCNRVVVPTCRVRTGAG